MIILRKILLIIIFFCVSSVVQAAADVSHSLRGGVREDSTTIVEKYLKNEQYVDAMLELNKALASSPNNLKLYILAADLLRLNEQYDEAEKMAKEVLRMDYKNGNAYTALGYIYMEKGETSGEKQQNLIKAFDHFFMSSQYNPGNPMPHIALAEAYVINMQKTKSLDEILKARELSFNNPEAYYKIGQYYYKINDYNNAEKYLEKSIQAGRDSYFRSYYTLGIILEKKGKIKEAQQKYLSALKLKPDYTDAQEKLDALIKVSYKGNKADKKEPKELFDEVDEDLRALMKADSYLMLDQYTEAHDLYVKLLEKKPDNTGALAGLAELYYAKWKGGYITTKNFTTDAIYIMKADVNKKNEIALLKFKMINERKMPEQVRERLINLSISESFEFYDLMNEIRSEYLLGNYEECHVKLLNLLDIKLSNYEKFRVLKHLIYDNNYYEAYMVLQELQKTYYHKEELEPVEQRLKAKFQVQDEKIKEAQKFYDSKQFMSAVPIYNEMIFYFPTYKSAYLHYAKTLERIGYYSEALDKMNVYHKLYLLYPDKEPEITEGEIKQMIQDLYKKMKGQIKQK